MSTTTDAWGIPNFGRTVSRRSLLNHYRHARPEVTLICAPSGFGKSVLAAEIASCDLFDRGVWLSAYGQPVVLEDIVERLDGHVQNVENGRRAHAQDVVAAVLPRQTDGSPEERLRANLEGLDGNRVCVVLDDTVLGEGLEHLCELLRLVRDVTSWESRLVVTSRGLGDFDPATLVCPYWIVDADELRLDVTECSHVCSLISGETPSVQAAEALTTACAGHAATVSVVATQRGLIDSLERDGDLPGSSTFLTKHFEQLACRNLSPEQRECLFVSATYGTGSLDSIEQVLPGSSTVLPGLADQIPLLRLGSDSDGNVTFYAHDVLASVVASRRFASMLGSRGAELRSAVIASLDRLEAHERVFALLSGGQHAEELIRWLEDRGPDLVEHGKFQLLRRALAGLAPERLLGSPRLLMTRALLARNADNLDDALRYADVAYQICRHEQDDGSELVNAAIVLARALMDAGRFSMLPGLLEPILDRAELLNPASEGMVRAYLIGAYGLLARPELSDPHVARLELMLKANRLPSAVAVTGLICTAATASYGAGQNSRAVGLMLQALRVPGIPRTVRLQAQGNLGDLLAEMGRLTRAREVLEGVLADCRASGAEGLGACFANSLGVVLGAQGDVQGADRCFARSLSTFRRMGDECGIAMGALSECAVLRSRGLPLEALSRIEDAVYYFSEQGLHAHFAQARLEWAACKLALGDSEVACETAQSILDDPQLAEALGHRLKADLIIAEAERAAGRFDAAAERMAAHADYILTESANWQLGMNIRAFPGLLGILARAIGPARIPAHLLAIVLPEHAERALRAAADHLIADEWQVLSRRVLPEDRAVALEREVRGTPAVRVRMFGGFEVVTPAGPVADRQWRKRKARLLFAMLVSKQGRAVPRDVLIEWLWPEMDDERGRNNFYVTWSTMRRALSGGGTDPVSPECVDNTNSICRIATNLVRSDLDDFDEALRDFRNAASAKHADGVRSACDRLVDIYRGELLPGDLYEDWFADQRSRYRHGLCDALLAGARLLDSAGDRDHASILMRAALSVDPWREDLYQAAMQLQIALGQRSGAIETFMACRAKLCDDLGIDPSRETQQLYQAILAMEEPP